MHRMSRGLRQLRRFLRLPALALLLLAVLANPVLAAIGDTHEASLGHSSHLDDASAHLLSDNARDGSSGDDGSDLLHALTHAVHCCGHMTALLPAVVVLPLPQFLGVAPRTLHALPDSLPASADHRPPIAA